jgi:hypothetical protein
MASLPVRGPGVRDLGVPIPPERMPLLADGRPLKRWRYVGVYGPELMLCVGEAHVAGVPQRWWAIALPDGTLHERTTSGRGGVELTPGSVRVAAPGISIELDLDEIALSPSPDDRSSSPGAIETSSLGEGYPSDAVEVASPHGRSYIWTRKQGDVPTRGRVTIDGREWSIDGIAFIDDSAGYHARHTRWRWSAGVGRGGGGERVAWNLVEGVHDAPAQSERTVWVDGVPHEVEPVAFFPDLSGVGELRFSDWATREDHTNRLLFRSHYRQPFGTFTGELPGGGPRLAAGYGVMEWHDVHW